MGLRIAVPAAVIATGAFRTAVRKIHGVALLPGLLLAFAGTEPAARDRRPTARSQPTRT